MRTKGLLNTKALLCPVAMLGLLLLAGCGQDAPPYAELPLRDALSASPEVLASLPEQALHDVAVRLEEAHATSTEQTAQASADIPTITALVRSADAQREDNGNDSIVLGAFEPATDGFVLRSVVAADTTAQAADTIALRGLPAESTAARENAALHGRAGVILTELAKQSEAREIVRMTGLPAGVVTLSQTMYVNGSWLVALSALDAAPAAGVPAPVVVEPPPLDPLSVRINPYNLPPSIAECAFDVRDVCTCAAGGLCDHRPTDPAFANGQAECEWVRSDPLNAEALCVLALMSIDAIRECVQLAASQCNKLPIGSRADAVAFVGDDACMAAMELCLDGSRPVPTPSSSGGSNACNSDGCSSCNSCNNDVGGCNKSCADCNDNCAQCNQNGKDCNQNCSDCNDNQKNCGKNSAQASQCRTSAARAGDTAPVPLPIGTLFWVFAPAGYILRRIRRRP